ncbi:hypothetical protein [Sphingobacterium bovistauri]|uniref:Tetratricopeptide repeat-containing protein n=1 Tax=Sphingobacterium bovistauri TaxID=2781959 RepID=A0ABS7Z2G0_9SPHI|nr:hypothetical protein [Sphingobacterium bovistauri]MCA5003641.1 hypothetical protein [Sphingobacterium bovistauri]
MKIHQLILVILLGVFGVEELYAQGKASVTARFNNTTRSKVFFHFNEKPSENMEFPYKAGQTIEFNVELDGITTLKINTFIVAFIQPGDSLVVDIDYEGSNYRDARFTGKNPSSILASNTINKIRYQRVNQAKYKTNIPAALAIQTPAKIFYNSTIEQWKTEISMLDEIKSDITPELYRFVQSEIDGIFIPNLINYPDNDKQEGYWNALDKYIIRDDHSSLSNNAYLGILNTYMEYKLRKEAYENNKSYERSKDLNEQYHKIAKFYDGRTRDAALLVFLYGAMQNGKDFETAEKLFQDYVKHHNINPRYKALLIEIMK